MEIIQLQSNVMLMENAPEDGDIQKLQDINCKYQHVASSLGTLILGESSIYKGCFSKVQKQTGVLQTKTGCENKVGSDLILARVHLEYDV